MFKIGQKSLLQRSFTRAAHAQVHKFEGDYMIIPDITKPGRVGHLHLTFKPHHGAFAAFPEQNDKWPGGGGGEARLELTEP